MAYPLLPADVDNCTRPGKDPGDLRTYNLCELANEVMELWSKLACEHSADARRIDRVQHASKVKEPWAKILVDFRISCFFMLFWLLSV